MKKRHSLFAKLFFIFFLSGVSVLLAITLSFHYLGEKTFQKTIDDNMYVYARLIIEKVMRDPYAIHEFENSSQIKIFSSIDEIQHYFKRADQYAFEPIGPNVSMLKRRNKFLLKVYNGNRAYYVLLKNHKSEHGSIDALFVAIGLTILILLLTYHSVQKTFSPIDAIREITREYGEGRFENKLPVCGSGQLADLTESINELADRMKLMLDNKRSMLLAIGHELKTPLARLRLQVEMQEEPSTDMIENITEMKTILDSILEAEKLQEHRPLVLSEVELNNFLKKFADERVNVKTLDKDIFAKIDSNKFDLALKNIIQNAKKYSPADKPIDLALNTSADSIEISIRDYGPGVSIDELSKITEAFYRPDSSRCRDSGGVGLGLYLVQTIVSSHGGKLKFLNELPGLKVRIILPQKNELYI